MSLAPRAAAALVWPLLFGASLARADSEATTIPPAGVRLPEVPAVPGAARWSLAAQTTYIWQHKPALPDQGTGPRSLSTQEETAYTLSATLFAGGRLWPGAELWLNPEVVQSHDLSNLAGLAGLTNGEAQKSGGPILRGYLARFFLRQTFSLGGGEVELQPGQNYFGGAAPRDRLTITVGRLAVSDLFDQNAYSHDPRTQFANWALWSAGAWDGAADTRGYSVGAAAELQLGAWAVRLGHFALPRLPNTDDLDLDLTSRFGTNLEVELATGLLGLPGRVRLLAFLDRGVMGGYSEALAQAIKSGGPPALEAVRRLRNKAGLSLNLEQELPFGAGLFLRASWADGQTETVAYAEIDRSLAVGVTVKGAGWLRPADTLGLAVVVNGASGEQRAFLSRGGVAIFVGDGSLSYGVEQIAEAYYSLSVLPGLWVTADAQGIRNPAYNSARAALLVLGLRAHAEF